MSLEYAPGEYNLASGTRDAFGRWADDLVAAGLPRPRSVSADRAPEVQVGIFVRRYRQQASGSGPYGDVRYWDGSAWGYPGGRRWVRHSSAGTVAAPGTGNHEKHRSNDLAWPYNSDTWQHRRAREIGKRHNITCDGIGFGEWWHWTQWGPLGSLGQLAGGDATPIPKEWDEMASREDIRAEVIAGVRAVLNEARDGNQNQTSANIAFIADQVQGYVATDRPIEGQLATAISRVTELLFAVDGRADPRIIDPATRNPVTRALAAFMARENVPSSGIPVDVDETAIVAGVIAGLAGNIDALVELVRGLPADTVAALKAAL